MVSILLSRGLFRWPLRWFLYYYHEVCLDDLYDGFYIIITRFVLDDVSILLSEVCLDDLYDGFYIIITRFV